MNKLIINVPEVPNMRIYGDMREAYIKDGSVTEEKLAAASVSAEKIKDGAVTVGKLSEELKGKINNSENHIANKENPHEVTKTQVGLGNADNTSDEDKPISAATKAALDLKANKTDIPTKTSELQNDSGFALVSEIPTKLSELENDSGYAKETDVDTKSSEIVNTLSGKMIAFHDSDDAHFKDIEISDTANTDVTVNVYRKNLANADDFLNLTPQVFEKQADGTYKGLANIRTSARIAVNLPTGTYTYKAKIKAPTGSNYRVAYWTEDGASNSPASIVHDGENFKDSVVTFTTQKPIIALGFNYGTAGVIDFKEMQLEVGSSATEYEEYKSQSVNLTLPLTDAQKDKFKALVTYKGTTTVSNDKSVDMSVSYKADTKLYIDNKFSELQSAIITLGGNV